MDGDATNLYVFLGHVQLPDTTDGHVDFPERGVSLLCCVAGGKGTGNVKGGIDEGGALGWRAREGRSRLQSTLVGPSSTVHCLVSDVLRLGTERTK